MYNILEKTPFGFVIEMVNDACYKTEVPSEIYLNDQLALTTNENVFSVLGLEPETMYEVKIVKETKIIAQFSVQTESVSYLVNVRDYNAAGDGLHNDTSAILLAIYTAPLHSTIFFPKGTYLVDYILLKSNTNFYFEKGTILKQNVANRTEMPIIKAYLQDYHFKQGKINTTWEGNPLDSYCPMIYGRKVENIKIYGSALLDGNGDISGFWETCKQRGIVYRPKNIEIIEGRNISLFGFESVNSSCWNIHLFACEDVRILNLRLKSIATSPNTDGINPECSKNITIKGCRISVGDDCIAIKSGKYFVSQYFYRQSENILIENCYLEKGHGGVVLGSEISCGATNIQIRNCIFSETDRGLRMKTRRGRGETSIMDGIVMENCILKDVKHGVTVNMFYRCDPDGTSDYVQNKEMQAKDQFTPAIRGITLKNIQATNIQGLAFFIYGLPESPVTFLCVKDSSFEFSATRTDEPPEMLEGFEEDPALGIYMNNIEKVDFDNVTFEGDYKEVIVVPEK